MSFVCHVTFLFNFSINGVHLDCLVCGSNKPQCGGVAGDESRIVESCVE